MNDPDAVTTPVAPSGCMRVSSTSPSPTADGQNALQSGHWSQTRDESSGNEETTTSDMISSHPLGYDTKQETGHPVSDTVPTGGKSGIASSTPSSPNSVSPGTAELGEGITQPQISASPTGPQLPNGPPVVHAPQGV
jgi:hypothetical protein